MKRLISTITILAILFLSPQLNAKPGVNNNLSVTDQLDNAQKKAKSVFLVVYDKEDENKTKALAIAKEAYDTKPKSIVVVEMDYTSIINGELIKKYRLSGAPLPLILVLDKNGTAVGGLPIARASASALCNLIPSQKFSEVLKAINEKKTVFVVAYKGTMVAKGTAVDACNAAIKKLNSTAVLVEVDTDDQKEAKLINSLRLGGVSTEPIICVVNSQGQIAGTFTSLPKTEELVAAAKKVVKGGCCPPGSGKTCGPKK